MTAGRTIRQAYILFSQAVLFSPVLDFVAKAEAASIQAGDPLFRYAALAVANTRGAITFSGNKASDSFDSSQGTYAATKQNSNVDVGANGNIAPRGTLPSTVPDRARILAPVLVALHPSLG